MIESSQNRRNLPELLKSIRTLYGPTSQPAAGQNKSRRVARELTGLRITNPLPEN
jgi:hypothetical protein